AGLYHVVLRAQDRDGDVDDVALDIVIDPAGVRDHAFVMFRGADLPMTKDATGRLSGRYDPTRDTQTLGSAQLCVPFSLADGQALFKNEYNGATSVLSPTSPLTMYGGWLVSSLNGTPEQNANAPKPTSWVGLREGQFLAWTGDGGRPTDFDAVLVWRKDQFAALGGSGNYRFTSDPQTCALRVDLTSLVDDGNNEIRFVIVHRDAGGDTWYLSEAAYTSPYLKDGYWQLDTFSGNAAPGKRWAVIPAPSGANVAMPPRGPLVFQAKAFTNVQAVGLMYHGHRWGYHYSFGFNRFFALGARQ
ncbi:MAG: hypothetical protein LWX11_05075, partial [Firmicutes bacterium]|nr:hypothetical protein [Bacillota bacterium]